MAALDDIAQERQRLSERLAKLDTDRAKLAEQLAELEAAERVLSRFTQAKPRRGRRAAPTAPQPPQPPSRVVAAADGVARRRRWRHCHWAMQPCGRSRRRGGTSAEDVRQYIADKFGMQVRPNHLGMALQRHRRAGLRLDQRCGTRTNRRRTASPEGVLPPASRRARRESAAGRSRRSRCRFRPPAPAAIGRSPLCAGGGAVGLRQRRKEIIEEIVEPRLDAAGQNGRARGDRRSQGDGRQPAASSFLRR